jgi:hypothetical protein
MQLTRTLGKPSIWCQAETSLTVAYVEHQYPEGVMDMLRQTQMRAEDSISE